LWARRKMRFLGGSQMYKGAIATCNREIPACGRSAWLAYETKEAS